MRKKVFLAVLAGLMLTSSYAYAAPNLSNSDAGAQMNRLNDYIERERVARQIEADRAKKEAKVEGAQAPETNVPEVDEVKLELKNLVTDASTVLTSEEIKSVTKDYVGKTVSIKDLYKAVERINALYQQKGYITCRAFLLQQTISDGVVKITLIEGKTGDVEIQNNKWTKANYIKNRVKLAQGEVENVNELNKQLLLFNATNDVQLRITMQAGQKPGTTDYAISVYEPKQYTWNVLVDNAGNRSTDQLREGVFFTAKSVSGVRDSLTIGNVNSRGSKAVTTSYSRSLGHSGTKLNIGYNTNSIKTVKGLSKDKIKGHSNAITLGVTQPLVINEKTRSEAILELTHQKSSQDFTLPSIDERFKLVNDTINDAFLGFAMTNYGNSHVFYQKHGFLHVNRKDIADKKKNHFIFKTNSFYQKAYKHGHNISARAEGQWSNKDDVPSARQFYIGGMNSIRGYEESFMGADKGINLSFEYAVPLNQKRTISAFTFFDYGRKFGEFAESSNANGSLFSTGLGIKATIGKNIYANMTLGVPLKRNLEDGHEEPSRARLHFMINGQF